MDCFWGHFTQKSESQKGILARIPKQSYPDFRKPCQKTISYPNPWSALWHVPKKTGKDAKRDGDAGDLNNPPGGPMYTGDPSQPWQKTTAALLAYYSQQYFLMACLCSLTSAWTVTSPEVHKSTNNLDLCAFWHPSAKRQLPQLTCPNSGEAIPAHGLLILIFLKHILASGRAPSAGLKMWSVKSPLTMVVTLFLGFLKSARHFTCTRTLLALL